MESASLKVKALRCSADELRSRHIRVRNASRSVSVLNELSLNAPSHVGFPSPQHHVHHHRVELEYLEYGENAKCFVFFYAKCVHNEPERLHILT